jgi:hypothetical protein
LRNEAQKRRFTSLITRSNQRQTVAQAVLLTERSICLGFYFAWEIDARFTAEKKK